MKKISKTELLAILSIAGFGSEVYAANSVTTCSPCYETLKATEHSTVSRLGADSACGAGACGADEKGARAAKVKRAKNKTQDKATGNKIKKSDKKSAK